MKLYFRCPRNRIGHLVAAGTGQIHFYACDTVDRGNDVGELRIGWHHNATWSGRLSAIKLHQKVNKPKLLYEWDLSSLRWCSVVTVYYWVVIRISFRGDYRMKWRLYLMSQKRCREDKIMGPYAKHLFTVRTGATGNFKWLGVNFECPMFKTTVSFVYIFVSLKRAFQAVLNQWLCRFKVLNLKLSQLFFLELD